MMLNGHDELTSSAIIMILLKNRLSIVPVLCEFVASYMGFHSAILEFWTWVQKNVSFLY